MSDASSRDKILDVAEALFADRGFAGVGLREVAEAVGLGKSSLFHHFRSKGELYYEALERVLGRIALRLGPVVAAPRPAAERLDRWVDTLIDALAEHPIRARLLLRALVEEDAEPGERRPEAAGGEAILASMIGAVQGLIEEGVEAGEFRPASAPHVVQTLIGATVYHFASGQVGEDVLGAPLFSADSVRERKREIGNLLRHGLVNRDR